MRRKQLHNSPLHAQGHAPFEAGKRWLGRTFLFVAFLFMMAMSGTVASAQTALPPAGAAIGNQAAATYTDGTGQNRIATSNTVVTIIQQVAGLLLEEDRNKLGAPNSPVYFPHTVTNTGNGADSYNLTATNDASGDNFNLGTLLIYPDANGDGVPDSATPITTTPVLAPGETFSFVVGGIVPVSATAGQNGKVTVTATSVFDGTVTSTNHDTVTVTDYAILDFTKSIDNNQATSPTTTGRTYTLTYINRGRAPATNVTITDVLDSRLSYVASSGSWNGVALTDAAGGDATGINYTRTGQTVTAVLTSIAPGASGTISFRVNVNSNVEPAAIPNHATYTYNDGNTDIPSQPTNTVELYVTPTVDVTGTGDTVSDAPQGSIVEFENVFTNTGTGTDTFDVTIEQPATGRFPSGTSFVLYQTGGNTPLLDSNGNTVPDTGPLAPGASYTVVLKAILPPSASGVGPYTVHKRATSVTDPSVSTRVDDVLTTITASTVDLKNPGSSPDGTGVGPEASAVTTLNGVPGSTVRFNLSVTNGSTLPDNYSLSAGSTTALAAFTNGFVVVFRNTSEGIITNSGNVAPGATVNFYADVTIPTNMAPVASPGVSVYFRAQSPNTGALDIKHDAVIVDRVRNITIEPDHTGQTYAGSSIVYAHTVTNNGNAAETVTLSTLDSLSGFTSVIYWDQDGDGVLGPTDPQITSSFNLPAGGSRDIFVKVFAPANAVPGNVDVTTITADAGGGVSDTATDTTSIVTGQLTMLKEQALDAALDGTPDTAYTTANLTTGALPGTGIRYRITVTNNSMLPVTNVIVNDTTPAFTTYHTGAGGTNATGVAVFTTNGTTFTAGSPVPTNGNAGALGFNIGTLNPGQTAVIYFGVRING